MLLSFKRPTYRHRTATVPIIGNFHLGYGYAKCFFSQSSKPNELIFNAMFYDIVCLISTRIVDQGLQGYSFGMRIVRVRRL